MASDVHWWKDEDNKESVVVPSVSALAVYTNTAGEIVIRQQDQFGGDDSIIVIPKSHAAKLASALREEAKKSNGPQGGDF